MKTLEQLPFSMFVRYGLTGLITLVVFGVVPCAVFRPAVLASLTSVGGVLSLLVIGLASGLVFDALKPYQFGRGYRRQKAQFMRRISDALEVDPRLAPIHFVRAAQLERAHGLGHIDLMHSRWVMIDSCARIFMTGSCVWGIVGLIALFRGRGSQGWPLLATSFVCLGLSLRLLNTALQERIRVADLYVHFCEAHKELLLKPDVEAVLMKENRTSALVS